MHDSSKTFEIMTIICMSLTKIKLFPILPKSSFQVSCSAKDNQKRKKMKRLDGMLDQVSMIYSFDGIHTCNATCGRSSSWFLEIYDWVKFMQISTRFKYLNLNSDMCESLKMCMRRTLFYCFYELWALANKDSLRVATSQHKSNKSFLLIQSEPLSAFHAWDILKKVR